MKIHIVKKGDTLYELSQKYNVPLDQVIALNPQITNPDQIDVGMKVKIPSAPKPVEPPATDYAFKHIVKQGDTLWKLGKAWDVPLQAMIQANPQLKNPNVLMTGEVIYIPKVGTEEPHAHAAGEQAVSPGMPGMVEAEPPAPMIPDSTMNLSELQVDAGEGEVPLMMQPSSLGPMGDISPAPTPGAMAATDSGAMNLSQSGMPTWNMPMMNMPTLHAPGMGMPGTGTTDGDLQGVPSMGGQMPGIGTPFMGMPDGDLQGMPSMGGQMPGMGTPFMGMPDGDLQGVPSMGGQMPGMGMPFMGQASFGMPQMHQPYDAVNPFEQFQIPATEAFSSQETPAYPDMPGMGGMPAFPWGMNEPMGYPSVAAMPGHTAVPPKAGGDCGCTAPPMHTMMPQHLWNPPHPAYTLPTVHPYMPAAHMPYMGQPDLMMNPCYPIGSGPLMDFIPPTAGYPLNAPYPTPPYTGPALPPHAHIHQLMEDEKECEEEETRSPKTEVKSAAKPTGTSKKSKASGSKAASNFRIRPALNRQLQPEHRPNLPWINV